MPVAQPSWSLSAIDDPESAEIATSGLAIIRAFSDASLVQEGLTVTLRRDDLAIVSGTLSIRHTTEADPAQILDFGRSRLALQIARGRKLNPTVLEANDPLATLLRSLWSSLDHVQQNGLSDDTAGRQLIEVVAGVTTRLLDDATVSRLSHYSSATLARAKNEIEAHFADPDFTVTTLAGKMRLSARRLLALFADEGTTTSGSIQDRRLRHARALLIDPAAANRRIAAIAAASGFRDQAYFSRSFRRTFGLTPKQCRDGGARSIEPGNGA